MNAQNRSVVDALCADLSAITDRLNAMHQELLLLRDAMRNRLTDERQEPLPLKRAA